MYLQTLDNSKVCRLGMFAVEIGALGSFKFYIAVYFHGIMS